MRKVTFGGANSLDNFFARKDDAVDWLMWSDEAASVMKDFWKKDEPGKDICVMGGGLLAKSLFEADLIDEIGFNVHPVLLGSGIPMFHEMNRQVDLDLIECRPFKNGTIMLSYRVKHARDTAAAIWARHAAPLPAAKNKTRARSAKKRK